MAICKSYTLNLRGEMIQLYLTDEEYKNLQRAIDKLNAENEPTYHTYFVSYIENDGKNIRYGNKVFATTSTGQLLAQDAVASIEYEHPNAVVISISKLD